MRITGEQILAIFGIILGLAPILFPAGWLDELSLPKRILISATVVTLSVAALVRPRLMSWAYNRWCLLCCWFASRLSVEQLRQIYSRRLAAGMRHKGHSNES